MNLTALYENAEAFVKKYDFKQEADSVAERTHLTPVKEIQATLQEYEGDKPLQIGIVGRVKAGKSSLLNAILFEGQDILPKAATPMTAALTEIEYSESIQAELEFFTEDDIADIAEKHDFYLRDMKKVAQEEYEKLKLMTRNKLKSEAALQNQATKIAERRMQSSPYAAAFDQYFRIKQSGVSLRELQGKSLLQANSIEELTQEKLNDFVGAKGKYMPFTKAVKLKIPNPNLKDLRIVDTPGINDPVQSRGRRTEEMLGKCDVILLVSPSGQFLSQEDMELMQRISSKEGIQEIYLIASQADNQLYGSEGNGLSNPNAILNNVSKSLTEHAKSSLKQEMAQVKQSMGGHETAQVYEKASQKPVICTSGVAYSLWKRFDQQQGWDENARHVWNHLRESFPDYFDHPETAKITLEKMANIQTIKDIIAELKVRKEEIQLEKIKKYTADQRQNFNHYLAELSHKITEETNKVKNADYDQLKKNLASLQEQTAGIENKVNSCYSSLVDQFDYRLPQNLNNELDKIIKAFYSESDSARGTGTETYRRSTGKSWWEFWKDEYETATRTVDTINAGAVRRAIKSTCSDIEYELNNINKAFLIEWRKGLQKEIVTAVHIKDAGEGRIKESQIIDALNVILKGIENHEFRAQQSLPRKVDQTGTLKGREAEEFHEAAKDYAYDLKNNFRQEIKGYCNRTVRHLKGLSVAERFTKTLKEQLNKLIKQVEAKEATLQQYERMEKELKQLQGQANGI